MKKITFVCMMASMLAVVSLPVAGQEDKKAAEARKELAEANQDLKDAKIDSAADFKKFRAEAEASISENHKKIGMLKARKTKAAKEVADKYDKKMVALEEQNNELKKRIKNSESTKTTEWTSFKREFNHDMDELWKAIKDVGVDSSK